MIESAGPGPSSITIPSRLAAPSCGGVSAPSNTAAKRVEPSRPVPVTFRDRHLWGYQCSWCGATESGFDQEHHARTIGDEHTLVHMAADLDGGSSAPYPQEEAA